MAGFDPVAYAKDYYRSHSTRPPMIPGATRESKLCKKCGEVKTRSEFSVRKSGPRTGHLACYCKPCSSLRSGVEYRAAHGRDPNRYRNVEWPSKLKRLYGITVDDYHRMLSEQGGGCAMCKATDPNTGSRAYKKIKRTAFDVDHCHTTGKVRGLLCSRCNRLVGLANDSADVARRLIEYLEKE